MISRSTITPYGIQRDQPVDRFTPDATECPSWRRQGWSRSIMVICASSNEPLH